MERLGHRINYINPHRRLADAVAARYKRLATKTGSLYVYKVLLKEEDFNVDGCRRFTFGEESLHVKSNRTIMVLGATGAGKSTLINGMINYILGVKWEDSFRFKLVDEGQGTSQAHSQTSEVTVYKLNHQEGFTIDHSLTIVDTPGFGKTGDIERDEEIMEHLRNLFSAEPGIGDIDAVCFVAQAALARLTPSQKYVFDSVLSIFGKDVKENIRILVTFADGQQPPVLEAIKESGVPCPKTKSGLPIHFKFNNSALFADNKSPAADSEDDEDEEGGLDQMFWNIGTKSMKKFFVALNVIETKSLNMTKEVLRERKRLQNSYLDFQKQIKVRLYKVEEISETSETLQEHKAEINTNKDFEYEVTVRKLVPVDISGAGSQKYRWEYEEVKERRTMKELKEKYPQRSEAETPFGALIGQLFDEYCRVMYEMRKLIESSAECLNRLKETTLKPNPLSTPEYINMLIEGEKSEAKVGWKQRVVYLLDIRGALEEPLVTPKKHFYSY